MSFLDAITSINQYSFFLLIFLFIISFFKKIKKIKGILFIRIVLGFFIVAFYFFGWETRAYYETVPLKGKRITFKHTEILEMSNFEDFSNTSPIVKQKFNKRIMPAGYNSSVEKVPKEKVYTVVNSK